MKNERCISYLSYVVAWAILASCLSAQEEPCANIVPGLAVCDDFADGNAEDGSPVTWTPVWPGIYDASPGDYYFYATPETGEFSPMIASATIDPLTTTSIRAQVRFQELGHSMGIEARRDAADQHGYWLAMQPTRLVLYRNNPGDGGITELGAHRVDIDVTQEDMLMQLDAIDDQLLGWIWRPGEQMPAAPQIEVQDSAFAEGVPALWTTTNGSGNATGAFRWVQVATEPIRAVPEPSTVAMFWLGFTYVVVARRAKPSKKSSV